MSKQLASWIPAFQPPAHHLYVTRLYRRSLRLCGDWYFEKLEYREKAAMIRDMFEANRNEANPKKIEHLLQQTEYYLAKYYHPIPFKCKSFAVVLAYFLQIPRLPVAPNGKEMQVSLKR
jgi:hypothetical protein